MKYAAIRSPSSDDRDDERRLEKSGGWWVRFGETLLVYSAKGKWDAVSRNVGDPSNTAFEAQGNVKKSDMHLVIQHGRAFQQEHPDVPVLLDRGRFLVVSMPGNAVDTLSQGDEHAPCFDIQPLKENTVVYETVALDASRFTRSTDVDAIVNGLDASGFESALDHLSSYHTRHSTSTDFADAAAWSRGQFEAIGLPASLLPITVADGTSLNVVAEQPGNGLASRGLILVVAHLDSINHVDGASAAAPGADDNASGAAGVLGLARALHGHRFELDLRYILFGGEEQGLIGSRAYVSELSTDERQRIRAVLNMDMIGSLNSTPASVLLEGAAISQDLIDGLTTAAALHTGLSVQVSLNPFGSDHMPFLQDGIPAVLTIEGADGANEAIHTANDTRDGVEVDYALDILRMNAAWLALEAGLLDAPQPPTDCGCGCLGNSQASGLDTTTLTNLRELNGHLQALFAQYSRAGRDGRLEWQDYQALNQARETHARIEAWLNGSAQDSR